MDLYFLYFQQLFKVKSTKSKRAIKPTNVSNDDKKIRFHCHVLSALPKSTITQKLFCSSSVSAL